MMRKHRLASSDDKVYSSDLRCFITFDIKSFTTIWLCGNRRRFWRRFMTDEIETKAIKESSQLWPLKLKQQKRILKKKHGCLFPLLATIRWVFDAISSSSSDLLCATTRKTLETRRRTCWNDVPLKVALATSKIYNDILYFPLPFDIFPLPIPIMIINFLAIFRLYERKKMFTCPRLKCLRW